MKRKASVSTPNGKSKKSRAGSDSADTSDTGPDKAFARQCPFTVGERVIGFYGGWPYSANVLQVREVRMTFGRTYILFVRWLGFSGKTATGWISEFDLVRDDTAGREIKGQMESLQRDRLKELGKVDKITQRKLFLQIVREVRGKKLAPLQPHTAPYPDEWQCIIRLSTMPKVLIDHLVGCETLVFERRLTVGTSADGITRVGPSVSKVLNEWLEASPEDVGYIETMKRLFNANLFKLMLYKFEIPLVAKYVVEGGTYDYCSVVPAELLLRLLNLLPQIVTAACNKSLHTDNGFVDSLVAFLSSHQSFMNFLVKSIGRFMHEPRKLCTLDDAAPEDLWSDVFVKDLRTFNITQGANVSGTTAIDRPESNPGVKPNSRPAVLMRKTKRKYRVPIFRAPLGGPEGDCCTIQDAKV
jgi:hypothetical protein